MASRNNSEQQEVGPVRILGIDPGSRTTGYGVITVYGSDLGYVGFGCIRTGEGTLPQRLGKIFNGISEVVVRHQPQQVAVEDVFMGRNAASALKLGHARGAAMTACLHHELPVDEYSPRTVKQAVVGTGTAAKEQVQHMVRALLAISDTMAEDAADALAVAICHANTRAGLMRLAGAQFFSHGRLR